MYQWAPTMGFCFCESLLQRAYSCRTDVPHEEGQLLSWTAQPGVSRVALLRQGGKLSQDQLLLAAGGWLLHSRNMSPRKSIVTWIQESDPNFPLPCLKMSLHSWCRDWAYDTQLANHNPVSLDTMGDPGVGNDPSRARDCFSESDTWIMGKRISPWGACDISAAWNHLPYQAPGGESISAKGNERWEIEWGRRKVLVVPSPENRDWYMKAPRRVLGTNPEISSVMWTNKPSSAFKQTWVVFCALNVTELWFLHLVTFPGTEIPLIFLMSLASPWPGLAYITQVSPLNVSHRATLTSSSRIMQK